MSKVVTDINDKLQVEHDTDAQTYRLRTVTTEGYGPWSAAHDVAGMSDFYMQGVSGTMKPTPPVYPSYPSTHPAMDVVSSSSWRRDMLCRRLRMAPSQVPDTGTLVVGDTVHIMVAVKGECVVLTDEVSLYPSDTLITQMRLLID